MDDSIFTSIVKFCEATQLVCTSVAASSSSSSQQHRHQRRVVSHTIKTKWNDHMKTGTIHNSLDAACASAAAMGETDESAGRARSVVVTGAVAVVALVLGLGAAAAVDRSYEINMHTTINHTQPDTRRKTL